MALLHFTIIFVLVVNLAQCTWWFQCHPEHSRGFEQGLFFLSLSPTLKLPLASSRRGQTWTQFQCQNDAAAGPSFWENGGVQSEGAGPGEMQSTFHHHLLRPLPHVLQCVSALVPMRATEGGWRGGVELQPFCSPCGVSREETSNSPRASDDGWEHEMHVLAVLNPRWWCGCAEGL